MKLGKALTFYMCKGQRSALSRRCNVIKKKIGHRPALELTTSRDFAPFLFSWVLNMLQLKYIFEKIKIEGILL